MRKKANKQPLVSIVIPTKNAGKFIGNCLASINKQSYPNIELIVIDNHSTDDTVTIARKYTSKVKTMGPERSKQRNYGVEISKGEFVAWFDADMELTPSVIKDCVNTIMSENRLDALVIPEKSVGSGYWAQCRALEKQCYLNDPQIEAARFVKKPVFINVGKMAENLISGEDWDLTTRLKENGYKIGRVQSFVLHNEGNLKFFDDLKKKYYYATKGLPYVKKHINGPMDVVYFIFRPAFFRNWLLLLRHPLLTIGLFTLKFSEFIVGFIGIISARLKQ